MKCPYVASHSDAAAAETIVGRVQAVCMACQPFTGWHCYTKGLAVCLESRPQRQTPTALYQCLLATENQQQTAYVFTIVFVIASAS